MLRAILSDLFRKVPVEGTVPKEASQGMKPTERAKDGKTRSRHSHRNVDQAIDMDQIANHFHSAEALSLF